MAAEAGERLRQLREAQGMSRHALGVAVGRVAQTVLNWENGIARPSIETVVKLGNVLDAKVELLEAFGYVADQSLAEQVRDHERRLNEQAAIIERLVAVVGLSVASDAAEAAKARRPDKS